MKSSESTNVSVDFDPNVDNSSQRIVVGFATLDNIDKTGDVVTSEASMKAFSKFRGNIRYMHERMPVGKLIDYQPAVYFDEETQSQHNGVQVTVKISEAEDAVWTKCQDGTLSGFSIGGNVVKTSYTYDEKLAKNVKVIEDYELTELSLVDNPANQFANITAIRKSEDGQVQEGDELQLSGTIEKVFEINTKGGSPTLPKENEIAKSDETQEVSVTDVNNIPAAETTEETSPVESEKTEETSADPVEEPTEEVVEDEESATDAIDIEAALAGALEKFRVLLEENASNTAKSFDAKIEEVNSKIEAVTSDVEKVSQANGELTEKVNDSKSDEKLDALAEMLKTFGGRLDNIAKSTAVRKSVDAQEETKDTEDGSPFQGLFSFGK